MLPKFALEELEKSSCKLSHPNPLELGKFGDDSKASVWGLLMWGGVCMCVHMCLSPSDFIVQPNLRTSEARAEFSDLAAGSCQTR